MSSGRGRVFTWTVVHQAVHPAFADEVPYAIVVTELEEGPRLVSGLRDLDVRDLQLGLAVEVGFELASEEISLPVARPKRR